MEQRTIPIPPFDADELIATIWTAANNNSAQFEEEYRLQAESVEITRVALERAYELLDTASKGDSIGGIVVAVERALSILRPLLGEGKGQ